MLNMLRRPSVFMLFGLTVPTVLLLWFTGNISYSSMHSFRKSLHLDFTNLRFDSDHRNFHYNISEELPSLPFISQSKDWNFYPQVETNYGGCFQNVTYHSSAPNWQVWNKLGANWYLFGAYWDNRLIEELTDSSDYAIRILIRRKKKLPQKGKVQCYIWYEDDTDAGLQLKIRSPVIKQLLVNEAPNYPAFLITCPVSAANFSADKPPIGVSLVIDEGESSENTTTTPSSTASCEEMENFLPIVYNSLPKDMDEKLDFAICHKALCFDEVDPSKLFIEWMEMHRILGVKQVFIYDYFSLAGTNISKALSYYGNQGFLQQGHMSIPEPEVRSNSREDIIYYLRDRYKDYKRDKWMMELITYHDCFYRNMYRFKYIALLDLDEIVMPIKELSWDSFVRKYDSDKLKNVKSFSFQNNIFPNPESRNPDAPNDSHLLQNVYRIQSKSYVGNRKLIYSTARSLGLHHHNSIFCLGYKPCWIAQVKPSIARLHHYCLEGAKPCPNKNKVKPLLDETAWKFKDYFVPAIEQVHRDLGFD